MFFWAWLLFIHRFKFQKLIAEIPIKKIVNSCGVAWGDDGVGRYGVYKYTTLSYKIFYLILIFLDHFYNINILGCVGKGRGWGDDVHQSKLKFSTFQIVWMTGFGLIRPNRIYQLVRGYFGSRFKQKSR